MEDRNIVGFSVFLRGLKNKGTTNTYDFPVTSINNSDYKCYLIRNTNYEEKLENILISTSVQDSTKHTNINDIDNIINNLKEDIYQNIYDDLYDNNIDTLGSNYVVPYYDHLINQNNVSPYIIFNVNKNDYNIKYNQTFIDKIINNIFNQYRRTPLSNKITLEQINNE